MEEGEKGVVIFYVLSIVNAFTLSVNIFQGNSGGIVASGLAIAVSIVGFVVMFNKIRR